MILKLPQFQHLCTDNIQIMDVSLFLDKSREKRRNEEIKSQYFDGDEGKYSTIYHTEE